MATSETWTMGGVDFTVGAAVFVHWNFGDEEPTHEGLNVERIYADGDMGLRDKRGDEWLISYDGSGEVWWVSQHSRDDWQVAFDVYVG